MSCSCIVRTIKLPPTSNKPQQYKLTVTVIGTQAECAKAQVLMKIGLGVREEEVLVE